MSLSSTFARLWKYRAIDPGALDTRYNPINFQVVAAVENAGGGGGNALVEMLPS
jgi:hypothetical protein